jgi:hypothetical protein
MNTGCVSLGALPDAPQADADLDLRALRAWLASDEDGDPVLVLQDGDTTVVLGFGLGGRGLEAAIQATGMLSEEVRKYGDVLYEVRAIKRAGQRVRSGRDSAEQLYGRAGFGHGELRGQGQ